MAIGLADVTVCQSTVHGSARRGQAGRGRAWRGKARARKRILLEDKWKLRFIRWKFRRLCKGM